MTSYRQIPPGRPDTLDELATLYGSVAEHQARRYYTQDLDRMRSLDDLRQDAWEGIIQAWHGYSPDRGMSFKSYAVNRAWWTIINNVKHVDNNLHNSWLKDRRAYQDILNWESLDAMADEFGDHLAHLTAPADEEYEKDVPLMWQMLQALDDMPRERYIVEQYHVHGRTLQDIGDELGLSRERVRQLRDRAYPVMRRRLTEEPDRQDNVLEMTGTAGVRYVAGSVKVSVRTAKAWMDAYGRRAVIKAVRIALAEHGPLLTVREAAGRLGLPVKHLEYRLGTGRVACARLFTAVRVPEAEVARLEGNLDLAVNSGLGL